MQRIGIIVLICRGYREKQKELNQPGLLYKCKAENTRLQKKKGGGQAYNKN